MPGNASRVSPGSRLLWAQSRRKWGQEGVEGGDNLQPKGNRPLTRILHGQFQMSSGAAS